MEAVPEHEALARGVPHVSMTLAEAEALSYALALARSRLRGLIARVERRTFEGRTIYDQREVVEIRAQLDSLDEFHRCHCKAWWPQAT